MLVPVAPPARCTAPAILAILPPQLSCLQSVMKKQILYTLGAMLGVVLILGSVKFFQIRSEMAKHASFAPPPAAVTTSVVRPLAWASGFDTVGSFMAVRGSTLSTQEAGNVAKVSFQSGSPVEAGQVLLALDTSVEEAKLRGARARLELARQHLARSKALRTQSAMSAATLEDAEAQVSQAEAEEQSIEAAIERKRIVAPFSGRAGIRAVNEGEYVLAGAPLVPLYTVDPIYFNFSVPQQIAPALKPGSNVTITVDAFPGRSFTGSVTAVNPQINADLRSIDIQATIPNSEQELLPGMFGRVELALGGQQQVLSVPLTAVSYAPYGDSVYVVERKVDESGTALTLVRQQIVQLGERKGDLVAVTKGLREGDEVVTTGTSKLRPEAAIAINNQALPSASENPTVKDS